MKFKVAIVFVCLVLFSCKNPVTSSAPVVLPGLPAAPNAKVIAPVRYTSLVSDSRSAQGWISEIHYENITFSLVDSSGNSVQLERRGDGIYSIDDLNVPDQFSIRRTLNGIQQDIKVVNTESFSGNLGGIDLRIGKFDDGDGVSHNLEVFFTNSQGYPVMTMTFLHILISDQVLTYDYFYEKDRLSSIVTRICGKLISVESEPEYAAGSLVLGEEVFE